LTSSIDPNQEAQYNMRARIPDHPEIFARWAAEAAAYRAKANGARLDQAYGPDARHVYDYFPADPDGARPIAVFIHGGYWQRMDRSFYSHLAAGPNAHGLDAAVAQYRLCPDVRVGDIFDDMRRMILHLAQSHGRRFVLAGHSAGGQLAVLLAAHDWAREGLTQNPIAAVLAISGVYDLTALIPTSLNAALRLDLDEARAASPLHANLAIAAPVFCVAGELETPEFHRQQSDFAAQLAAKGVAARAELAAGHHHFSIIEPLADPGSTMIQWLVAQAR
jgi:arylformamidase